VASRRYRSLGRRVRSTENARSSAAARGSGSRRSITRRRRKSSAGRSVSGTDAARRRGDRTTAERRSGGGSGASAERKRSGSSGGEVRRDGKAEKTRAASRAVRPWEVRRRRESRRSGSGAERSTGFMARSGNGSRWSSEERKRILRRNSTPAPPAPVAMGGSGATGGRRARPSIAMADLAWGFVGREADGSGV